MARRTVRKRDGTSAPYERGRIVRAVERARLASGSGPEGLGERVADFVERALGPAEPTVEAIQDAVESALVSFGAVDVARAYILYRHGRSGERRAAGALGVRDDLKLGLEALHILEERYLRRDEDGHVAETPGGLFRRVARAVAEAEIQWGGASASAEAEERFLAAMTSRAFLPNSPALMNAGTPLGQLAACFVLPIEDTIPGIFDTLGRMARIHQSGGGTGFSFGRLRPAGDAVLSTGGRASGPVSFMRVYDMTTEVIKQGGRRRGANMAVLPVDHPDVMDFIRSKSGGEALRNFNISVAVTDDFMRRAAEGREYELVNPRTGLPSGKADASAVLDLISWHAWESGEPGLLFIDAIERGNPTPALGRIEATNPCGEQPLLPYESCVLGSVNLVACLSREGGCSGVDWEKLADVIRLGVRFLDDCVEVSRFPVPEIAEVTRANRKIGLGVMGLADLFYELEIPYDSDEALDLAGRLAAFLKAEARKASGELARERGVFPNHGKSVWADAGGPMRNASVTTVAPTGTLSLLAGVSSGIEPRFALVSLREMLAGSRMMETAPAFERFLVREGLDVERAFAAVARTGSARLAGDVLPEKCRRIFATALDIAPEWHVRMQAAFQRHIDSAVSKTVNLPNASTPANVRDIYRLAHQLGAKGITVYRYGSRSEQVLSLREADSCGEGRQCGI